VSIRAGSLAVALSSSLVVACIAGPPSAGEPEAAQALSQAAPSAPVGDGRYPVYVGFSTAGRPVTVLVDCEILPWPAAGPAPSAP
jgi:hypothetical protein